MKNRSMISKAAAAIVLVAAASTAAGASANGLAEARGRDIPLDDRRFSDAASLDTALPVVPDRVAARMPQDETADFNAVPNDESAEESVAVRGPRAGNFGDEGTWRINFFGTGAVAFSDSNVMYGGFVSLSYFLVDDFSVEFELGVLGFGQEGPDTWGGNANLLIRWHFVSHSTWSIFFDAGAGFLKTNDDVPADGSNYNFTPQAGFGFSMDVGADIRLLAGVRWHHISNANLADNNPGRDSVQFWAGLSIPF